ncbi:MAG: TolC family protein [Rhodoferax sp.]
MHKLPLSTVRRATLACALALPGWTLAQQTPSASPALDWRQANDTVGRNLRGHADVLRSEQAQAGAAAQSAAAPTLPSAAAAVRLAWSRHTDLLAALQQLPAGVEDQLSNGAFHQVDPALQRRVSDWSELLEVAVQARKAWLEAVAARAVLRRQREALEAAESADALGQRMVAVGNWSRLQYTPVQVALTGARMELVRAEYAAVQAQAALARTVRWAQALDTLVLPDELPALPTAPLAMGAARQRLHALQAQSAAGDVWRSRAAFDLAWAAYQGAHRLAQLGERESLPISQWVSEETLLHYNGMLKSVWDVLAQARGQSQLQAAQANALRDFWLADADLQWVLLGGLPQSAVALGGVAMPGAAEGGGH